MCGRYTLTDPEVAEHLAALWETELPEGLTLSPRFNIAPTDLCPIVVPGQTRPRVEVARWGFELGGKLYVNLRSETAPTRSPKLWTGGRCVVPADGFYDWKGPKGERQPVWFHAPDRGLLWMAGLVEGGRFIVLTTEAHGAVATIHDRMPVLLALADARHWLAGAPPVENDVALVGQDASPRVSSVKNDDPSLLQPPAVSAGQLRLF